MLMLLTKGANNAATTDTAYDNETAMTTTMKKKILYLSSRADDPGKYWRRAHRTEWIIICHGAEKNTLPHKDRHANVINRTGMGDSDRGQYRNRGRSGKFANVCHLGLVQLEQRTTNSANNPIYVNSIFRWFTISNATTIPALMLAAACDGLKMVILCLRNIRLDSHRREQFLAHQTPTVKTKYFL